MARLPKFLLLAASILSLVLLLVTAFCWVRGYWYSDYYAFVRSKTPRLESVTSVGHLRGHMLVLFNVERSGTERPGLHREPTVPRDEFEAGIRALFANHKPGESGWYFAGIGWARKTSIGALAPNGPPATIIVAPCWLLCILFAIAPTLRIIHYVRRARQNREGLCPNCGYDLRATPHRCPECGLVIEAKQE